MKDRKLCYRERDFPIRHIFYIVKNSKCKNQELNETVESIYRIGGIITQGELFCMILQPNNLYISIWIYPKGKKSLQNFRYLSVDGSVGVVILRLNCGMKQMNNYAGFSENQDFQHDRREILM